MADTVKATWERIASGDVLQRSSHSVAATAGKVFVFGGELVPRKPRDGDVHAFEVGKGNGHGKAQPETLSTTSQEKPTARVGATLTALDDGNLYIFSGRGGEAMAPIDENGALWSFNPRDSAWSLITLADATKPFPEARSYHASASDGHSRLFIHAGCPEKGRLKDFWSFDVGGRVWEKLPDAPGPERGGTSLAFADGKVWRMGGFDGQREVGGVLDWYDFKYKAWSSIEFPADGKTGPGARSVSAVLPVVVDGRQSLLTLFGEADPSSLGHAGAGKMLQDAWVFGIGSGKWRKVEAESQDGVLPAPRGWFGAAVVDARSVVVVGGLGEDNGRLDDAWLLRIQD